MWTVFIADIYIFLYSPLQKYSYCLSFVESFMYFLKFYRIDQHKVGHSSELEGKWSLV